jgi:hypothetical protein
VMSAAPSKDVTATENVLSVKDIKIYPNPATSELVISLSSGNIQQVTILNLSGQEVFNQSYNSAQATADMKNLAPGMYLVKVNGEYAGKIVKE